MTNSQIWAVVGIAGALLTCALFTLAHIASQTPRLVDQRDKWERMAKRADQGAKDWRDRAQAAEQYAAALPTHRSVTPPPGVRAAMGDQSGPIGRRVAEAVPDAARGQMDHPTAQHAQVRTWRPQADDVTL